VGFLRVFRWIRRLVYLVVVVAFVYLVVSSAQVVLASRSTVSAAQAKPAAAIVVIGSATGPGPLSSDLTLRCREAVALYQSGRARLVITTGASSSAGAATEASAAAACLRARGVHNVTLVPVSPIPSQLSSIAKLLPASDGGRVILVADPLQTKWLTELATAEKLHARVVAVPAPKGSFWGDIGTIWGQAVDVAFGRLVGYQNTGWIGG